MDEHAYVSTHWLIQQIVVKGFGIMHLLRITHRPTGSSHYLAILDDHRYICDCCMSLYLGIPCRHYFRALTEVKTLTFHIGLIRPRYVYIILITVDADVSSVYRWYQDPTIDLETIPSVSLDGTKHQRHHNSALRIAPAASFSNPMQQLRETVTPAPVTQTLSARTIYQESVVELRNQLQLAGVQTQEQLDSFLEGVKAIR